MIEVTRIAIVGGGATGTLAALHLARAFPDGAAEIFLIEPGEAIGRGVAYSTDDPRHLLNVRVANMSAFADQPDHLLQWLQREASSRDFAGPMPFSFIPRGLYGAYLADLARELFARGAVRHVRGVCVDLVETGDSVTLKLATGQQIAANWAILATGNDPKPVLEGMPAVQPWTDGTFGELAPDEPILIVGSGLTMVDMALSLDRRGHRGKITALSHRGLVSLPHRPVKAFEVKAKDVPFGAELSELTAWVRRLALTVAEDGGDWRSAIDAMRPHTQRLWRAMSLVQKRRFLRHARTFWDVHRHRMAPEVEIQIVALRAMGRLEIVAGRIVRAEQGKNSITVAIALRGSDHVQLRDFARLINCTGLTDDPHRLDNPLLRALLARGAARVDSLGIGLDIDEDFALIDATSQRSKRVRAVGPLARAAFWECIAIPDIRMQCSDLAQMVAASAFQDRKRRSTPSNLARSMPTEIG